MPSTWTSVPVDVRGREAEERDDPVDVDQEQRFALFAAGFIR